MKNERAIQAISVAFLLLASVPARCQQISLPAYKVGTLMRRYLPNEPYIWRGAQTHALITQIWYPADAGSLEQDQWIGSPDSPLFRAGKAPQDGKLAASPVRFPLIVLSHGTGGSAKIMAWLATALAAHGYVVAAVNHPGNNSLEPYKTQGFTLWWERAKDLNVVLDLILADPTLGNRIDPGRIGAAGFSLGGYSVIELAGGITDRNSYRRV